MGKNLAKVFEPLAENDLRKVNNILMKPVGIDPEWNLD